MQGNHVGLADISQLSTPDVPIYSEHGYVVDADGNSHAVKHRWFHGVLVALLHPEEAADLGCPLPVAPLHELDLEPFLEFERLSEHSLNVIRVKVNPFSGNVNVSKGQPAATPSQVNALAHSLKALGVRSVKVNAAEPRLTDAEQLDSLLRHDGCVSFVVKT